MSASATQGGHNKLKLECGPMPNVIATLPNIAGALRKSSVIPFLVPRRKDWLTSAAGVPCNNAAKYTRAQDLDVK